MEMKHKLISLLVALTMVASLCAVTALPAAAQLVEVSIAPTSGPVGQLVEVSGYSPRAEALVRLTYDGATVDTIPAAPKTSDTETAGKGYKFSFWFKVPASTAGDHDVKVSDGVYSETKTFAVKPKVTVSPTSGPKDTTVTVTGTGFGASVGVDVLTWDDANGNGVIDANEEDSVKTVVITATDSKGGFSATFTAKETKAITAWDGAGNKAEGTDYTATFTLKAKLSLDPTSDYICKKIEATGSNYPAVATDVTGVTFAGVALTEVASEDDLAPGKFYAKDMDPETAGRQEVKDGELDVLFVVPADATKGIKLVKVTTDAGGEGSAKFTVLERSLTISPEEGPIGTTVAVSGVGFPVEEGVTIQLLSDTTILKTWTVTANSEGKFTATITTEKAKPGDNTIKAIDIYGTEATATFTVPTAKITISPDKEAAGATVSISGEAFTAYSRVIIKFLDPSVSVDDAKEMDLATAGANEVADVTPVPSVLTDARGKFSTSIRVPGLSADTYPVWVGAGSQYTAAAFEVTAAPALVPAVESALSYIAGKYEIVWGFDAKTQSWKLYDPENPEISDLEKLEKGKGYWIKAKVDCTLVYGSHSYTLYKGWNLIGWLGE